MAIKRNPKKKNIQKIKGSYRGSTLRVGIVVAEFNELLTERLLETALDTLVRSGVSEKNIVVVYVPGAFEIPLALKKMLRESSLDVVLTLAVVIRGETKHFDQVTLEASRGAREVMLSSSTPVILGMIPAENQAQALSRLGIKQTSKGREWALAAIEMANLMKESFKLHRSRT